MSRDELRKEEIEERVQDKNTFLIANYLKEQNEIEYYSTHTV